MSIYRAIAELCVTLVLIFLTTLVLISWVSIWCIVPLCLVGWWAGGALAHRHTRIGIR